MRYIVQLVNPSIFPLRFALFAALRCEGQNYSKRSGSPQEPLSIPMNLHPVALP